MGASVVARCHATPVLEFGDHVFDTEALAVELGIIGKFGLAVLASGDARLDALRLQGLAIPVAVVATVSNELLGWR